jgi:hypothetical protein
MRPDDCHLTAPILLPMFVYVCWVALLYVVLTVVRAPGIWGVGRLPDGTNPWAHLEPRVSANLRNQFEWPILFYVACLLALLGQRASESPLVLLAWIFVAGRLAHSGVQILTGNVRLRGLVFTVNFLAVLCMWGLLLA